MQCECCGREKEVLIEIGAVSPKVAATGLKLIHRLEELETDDDQFPQYQIEAIRELIGEI